jgi:c-di-GMP-binding flagellar brake protein YcgR
MNEFSGSGRERRQSVRITETLPFVIGHEGFEVEAVTINLSCLGAMCRVSREIPMMTQLAVALSLPGDETARAKKIRMKAVVVRKEKEPATGTFLIAIYFSDIKPEDRSTLEAFIKRRSGRA